MSNRSSKVAFATNTDIELVEIDYSQARIKALEKCVAEAKQYSPKPAAGWYRFEKNVPKGGAVMRNGSTAAREHLTGE